MEPESIEEVLALIENQPEDAELFQLLGQLHFKAGHTAEAKAAYERSLELDPEDAFTHLWLGNWFCRQDDDSAALTCFQRAAEFLPDHSIVYWCQGDAYRELHQFHNAQEAYQRAAQFSLDDPETPTKYAGRIRSLIRSAYREDRAATTVLLAAHWLRDHPDDLGVTLDYAEMLYQMTRYHEAIQVYQGAIERFEDARWVLYNRLGSLFRYRGDFQEAEQWFRKAIDEDPNDASSYIFLGAVLARDGKLREAESVHRRATRCSEGCLDEAWHNLGLVLRGQGRLSDAAPCFRKAIEIEPEYANAIEALEDVESALALSHTDFRLGERRDSTTNK